MARIRFPANAMRCDATSDIQLWISNPNTNKRAYLSSITEKVPRMRPLWPRLTSIQEFSISPLILLGCSMYCKASPDFKWSAMWPWNNQSICPNSVNAIAHQHTVYNSRFILPTKRFLIVSHWARSTPYTKSQKNDVQYRLSFHSYS